MKTSLFLFLIVAFSACQSKEEKGLTKAIEDQLYKMAADGNHKITSLEIDSLTYTLVSESKIDSAKREANGTKSYYYLDQSKEHTKKLREITLEMGNAKRDGNNALFQSYSQEANKETAEAIKYQNLLKKVLTQDSLLVIKQKSTKVRKPNFYQTRFVCKSTIDGITNTEKLEMYFDENLKYIQIE